MDSANRPHPDLFTIINILFNFFVKHILGLSAILFGVVAKVYIVRREWKRVSKWQCRMSVFFSGLAGSVTYMALINSPMSDMYKAIIIGFMPIVVEPIMMRTLIWVNPIVDGLGNFIKEMVSKKTDLEK